MPQVQVTIDGKSYRMACGPGEEPHLTALAEELGRRVAEMRKAFGEIGDMRLQVMTAITIADELAEARRRLAAAEAETAALRAETGQLAAGLTEAAERIERMAQSLAGSEPREG
ncbi:cell division protein ZapA [Methylobacterium radiodurans]|uniref:Cell division protein ZapA n=1 Tax=Methylobacterium radiodurans TaxID=2202828 RepID=A0A2U8VLX3_9HYPH|nr:cell division protein ZapA [Methylobacterium radiodurans]AWN34550.1 cell division protein ZapA [Methylobacterium radiodurans]